jgi:predicted methyltransferase
MNKRCAERIINEIPEIKGVLKGDIKQTVGLKDSNSLPHVYKLLAGCDMRCDIVLTPYGALCIYKNQAEIHVEFSKPISPKIEALKKIIAKYNDFTVLDCTCGPGTLGIACLKSGAKKVVFNDLWYPAAKMALLNLEVNGFKTNFFEVRKGLIGSGKNFEVYCENIMDLKDILTEKFDICIIDTFPGVDITDFVASVKEMCREGVII